MSQTIEIHSLMVGENRDDVELYQGRTCAEMVGKYLAAEGISDAEFVSELEVQLLAHEPYPGSGFIVGDDDSVLYQYVVARL